MNITDSQRAGHRRPYQMVARAASAEATGQSILDAATELFTATPYEQVTLREVAARARVTVQTVIRRFGSKEELFSQLARRRSEDVRAHREQAPTGDLAGAVSNLVDSYERFGISQLHLLSEEGRAAPISEAVAAGRRYHQRWVQRVFAPWLSGLGPADRRLRETQLVAVTDIYTWKVMARDLGLPRPQVEATLADLIERLLGGPGAARSQ